jgi:hypothetical protein
MYVLRAGSSAARFRLALRGLTDHLGQCGVEDCRDLPTIAELTSLTWLDVFQQLTEAGLRATEAWQDPVLCRFDRAELEYRKRADGMHALRHFYASVLLAQGVPI